ncbi:SCO family protein [Modestobacter sp. NPDC049651]|uniref:SCO family protein n=1 Tax=unclassified Modestobacter TaxID=2643866 RepID=UPI0033D7C383
MTSQTPRRALAALLLSSGLLLAACSGDDSGDAAAASSSGHQHGAPAEAEGGGSGPYEGTNLGTPYQKPEFTLTDVSGAGYDFAQRTGSNPTLLFFGYTNCPDVCPTTMADIAVALRQVDPAVAQKTNVVFVTTDPARDTPQALGTWLGRFDGDLPTKFVGLTGDQQQLDQAQLAAGVPLAEDGGQTHSALVLLYGADGKAHVAFNAADTPKDMAHDLELVAKG